jgi:hypothetical protein
MRSRREANSTGKTDRSTPSTREVLALERLVSRHRENATAESRSMNGLSAENQRQNMSVRKAAAQVH